VGFVGTDAGSGGLGDVRPVAWATGAAPVTDTGGGDL